MNLCECGCGVSVRRRFAPGHNRSGPQPKWTLESYTVEDRGFETPCWIYTGRLHTQTGYGVVRFQKRQESAHVASYLSRVGSIPEGHQLHHLCHVKACINPEHLVPLTKEAHTRLHGLGNQRVRGKHWKNSQPRTAEYREKQSLRMLGNNYAVGHVGGGSKPCPPGCTCGKHRRKK